MWNWTACEILMQFDRFSLGQIEAEIWDFWSFGSPRALPDIWTDKKTFRVRPELLMTKRTRRTGNFNTSVIWKWYSPCSPELFIIIWQRHTKKNAFFYFFPPFLPQSRSNLSLNSAKCPCIYPHSHYNFESSYLESETLDPDSVLPVVCKSH